MSLFMSLDLPQAANISYVRFMARGQTGTALARAIINATYLHTSDPSLTCGGFGWAEQLHPRTSRLTLLLDAGWMESASGTACPAFSKFPPSGTPS